MTECRVCGKRGCDDDCEELQAIYREQQREKLRDIVPEDLDAMMEEHVLGQDPEDWL